MADEGKRSCQRRHHRQAEDFVQPASHVCDFGTDGRSDGHAHSGKTDGHVHCHAGTALQQDDGDYGGGTIGLIKRPVTGR